VKLLVDINIVLDVLLRREPHVAASKAVFDAIERGEAEGCLSAHAFTTLWYLLRRGNPGVDANALVTDLHAMFRVAPVDGDVLLEALALGWGDYEDAVTAAAARRAGCDAIVTRDPRGFPGAVLPVVDPAGAIALIAANDAP
jgi:predicted nucleic acid-binding protein